MIENKTSVQNRTKRYWKKVIISGILLIVMILAGVASVNFGGQYGKDIAMGLIGSAGYAFFVSIIELGLSFWGEIE